MQGGLFASYKKIRIRSNSTFSPEGFYCKVGGVGTNIEHTVKTVSVANIFDPPNTDILHYTAYFNIVSRYKDPEPQLPNYYTSIEFKLFNTPLFSYNWTGNDPDTSGVPSYVNMEFILKEPKFFIIKTNNGCYATRLVASGYYLRIVSDAGNINYTHDSNQLIEIQKYTANPSEFIFLGGGLYGNLSINSSEKGGCEITLEPSTTLEYGIQYMFEGEDVYRDLPIKIDYLTHNLLRYPIITGSRTSNVRIEAEALYSVSGLSRTIVNSVAGLQIIPKRERKFIRVYNDDNSVLVYRGTHPRLGKLKRINIYTNSGSQFQKEFVELLPKCGQLLHVLNEEPEQLEEEVIDYEFVCPYNIGVFQSQSVGGSFTTYDYASHLFFENTAFPNFSLYSDLDGGNYRDENNPIFAHLLPPCINTVYFGSGSFQYELYNALINNLYSFWNWCLYFPPDEDGLNWLLPPYGTYPIPEKITNNEYWGWVREQWIEHTRLPNNLRSRKRNYIKDAPLYASEVSARTVKFWNDYFEYHTALFFPWNVYTPDEQRSGNLFSYLGFHNSRIIDYAFDTPEVVKANNIARYQFENCTGVSLTDYIAITPTATTIKVKYKVGSHTVFPYLFDILANKVKYKLSGSNISSVNIILKSFSGNEKVLSNVNLDDKFDKNNIIHDEKWASSAIQDYSANMPVPQIDKGIEIDTNNVSSSVFSSSTRAINYSLLSSANIDEIIFEINLSSLSPINFYWLEFEYYPRDYWHIIENANNDVFVSPDFYFRFGNLSYFDRDNDAVRAVPELKPPTYRATLIDGLCFSRLFFEALDKSYVNLRTWLHSKFSKHEAYERDEFGGENAFINDNSILPFDYDTYWFPIFNVNRKTNNQKIRFLYGSYYSMLPPVSSIPQFSYNQDNLEKEYIYLFCPHKRFLWNYKKQLRLYKVSFNDNNEETERLTYSVPATEYAIPNVFVEKYNIEGGYTNKEYIKDYNNVIVNSPRYIVGDGEKDLSRITPFHGHTYNYSKEEPTQASRIVYRAFQDITQNEKIYLLGYNINSGTYCYGYYNLKTNELFLPPHQERSAGIKYLDSESYLLYDSEFGTNSEVSRYEYKYVHSGDIVKSFKLKGRRPVVLPANNHIVFVSYDDRHNIHCAQYCDYRFENIIGNPQLIFSNLSNIEPIYPYAEAATLLDKEQEIFLHAYHFQTGSRKDVAIKFMSIQDGYFLEEFENHTLYFSTLFNLSNIDFSYPSISELNNAVIVWAVGSDKKVYGIKLYHNYRVGRVNSLEKAVINQPYNNLLEYHTPCVYTPMQGGIMFLNTSSDIKVIYVSEEMRIM